MTNSKLLPIGAIVVGLAISAAAVATAQNTPETEDGAQVSEQMHKAHSRDGRDGRGKRQGRRGGRGGGGEMLRMIFAQADADGDGSLTQEEIDAYRTAKLGEVDASGDGALSIEEFETLYNEFTRSRMVDAFQRYDADGDSVISAEEMDARLGNIVERMDRDDDGALTIQDRGRRG